MERETTRWRRVPTWVHGIEDYLTAAALPVLPRVLGWGRKVTHLFDSAAAAITAESLLTDYELGAVKLIPMQCHLMTDVVIGAGMVATGAMMDDEPQSARLTMVGLGLYAIASALLTKAVPSRSAGPSLRMADTVRRTVQTSVRGRTGEPIAAAAGGA